MFSSSRAVREQSLSRRDPGQTSETQPLLHNTDPHNAQYADPHNAQSADPHKAVAAPPKTSTWKSTAGKLTVKFAVGTLATMAGISLLRSMTGSGSSSQTSTPPTSTTSTTNPNQATYYPSTPNRPTGYQRRALDKGLPADIFGEAYFESRFIKYVADCIATTAGPSEAEARSVSDNER